MEADLLISLGGGSAHDTAKGIAVLIAEGGNNILDYRVIFEPPDKMEIPILRHQKLPIITIATTLAGAEVIGAAGYTDPATKLKKIVVDPKLTPQLVIYDPEVALTTPVQVFVSSGMNTFDHCVETVYSKKHQYISDTLALKAISTLTDCLPKCVEDEHDLDARAKAQVASFMAALAYSNSWLGINHAICHCLGARYGVPHGIANAIMLPHGMHFNLDVTEDRQAMIAEAMGIGTNDMSHLEAGEAAAHNINQLNKKLGLPRRLKDVGVPEEGLALLAEDTMQDRQLYFNPKPIKNKEQVLDILRNAW
jgi:alcohol dehydrogenase